MVGTCTEEGEWIYQSKDVEDETKTTEKIKVMQRVDIMEEDAKASVSWRQMSTVATPIWAAQRHKNKEKEQVKEEYMICWVFFCIL